MEEQINSKVHSSAPGTDVGYWEALLQQLKAFMARVSEGAWHASVENAVLIVTVSHRTFSRHFVWSIFSNTCSYVSRKYVRKFSVAYDEN